MINNLSSFQNWVKVTLPSVYDEGLTYLEQLNKVIENLITIANQTGINSKEIYDLQNYFKNLDLQTEINIKLDLMAESGELSTILADFLNLNRFFNTTLDLLNETSIIKINKNFIIETYGYSSINDGGSTKILITDTIPTNKFYFTLKNNLYGIPLTNLNNVLIYGIKNDGITDNTILLNQIINYTNKLYFPAGTYLFSNLNIINKDNFEIYGDSKKTSILKCNSTNTTTFFKFISLENGNNYRIHDIKIDSNYIGINISFSFINVNNSTINNCEIIGSTSQRTLNLQNFDSNYGHNNKITNNNVIKDCTNSTSGALIESTGELSGTNDQYLFNTLIEKNNCIVKCTNYVGDNDLFDCIETDNCYYTTISNNYCETTLHNGISLDTRNIKTLCINNICISKSNSHSVNGIEVTGSYGAEVQEGIISNNIIDSFKTNGISVNAKNYKVSSNKINNTNRGIILLELCSDLNLISDNVISNYVESGIFVSGDAKNARIINNIGKILVSSGNGGGIFIISPMTNNDLTNGLSRIIYINGIHVNDWIDGIKTNGVALDCLSDGRLLFYNHVTGTWQSITKTNI